LSTAIHSWSAKLDLRSIDEASTGFDHVAPSS
jgi:hypothetical protein